MKQYKTAFVYERPDGLTTEARTIREHYAPRTDCLRPADRAAEQRAALPALLTGLLGAMILGPGMSLLMAWSGELLLLGILTGLIGMTLVCSAYPVYRRVLQRELLEPEVGRLTDVLAGGRV